MDGGKWLCDPHKLMRWPRGAAEHNTAPSPAASAASAAASAERCLVYSVGSNQDTLFEAAAATDLGCEVRATARRRRPS